MALSGFLSKCPITISRTAVGGNNVTDFPVLLNQSNFPSDIFNTSGGIQISGGDVRFSSDSAGTIELPRDIVAVDKASSQLVVRVLVPTVNGTGAGSDTVIYMWWNNVNAGEPGTGTDSFRGAVYENNYYAVFDFETLADGWKGVPDSTGQYSGINTNGTIDSDDGHVAGTSAVRLSSSFGFDLVEFLQMVDAGSFEMQFWVNFEGSYTTGDFILGQNGISIGWAAESLKVGYSATAMQQGNGQGGLTTHPDSGWQFHTFKITTNVEFWRQGQTDPGYGNATSPLDNMANIGGNTGCPSFLMSGLKFVRDDVTPSNWQPVIYSNESNVGAFASAGTVETVSVAATLTITNLQPDSEIIILESGTTNEYTSIENSGTEFNWEYSVSGDIDIIIHNVNYNYIRFEAITLTGSDVTVPINQIADRWYENP